MSETFKGLKTVRRIATRLSKTSGVAISVGTASCEPTHYGSGQFYVDRTATERALIRLFNAYAPKRDNSWREYGEDFENEVFRVRCDRQDGDCSCGFNDLAEAWSRSNPHAKECYLVRRRKACEDWKLANPNITEYVTQSDMETVISKELCRELEIPWNNGWGPAVHCTCGTEARWLAWLRENDHIEPCDIWWMGQPNFLHRASGYGIHWYKYPCREAYGNQECTPQRFRSMIRQCISSLSDPAEDKTHA